MENVEYMLFALFWVCSNPKKSLEKNKNLHVSRVGFGRPGIVYGFEGLQ